MRQTILITLAALAAVLIIVVVIGVTILDPNAPLIGAASFEHDAITPNADGVTDITSFHYTLARAARVTLALENEGGQMFYFRQAQERAAGDYSVAFSGVVDGYLLQDESLEATVERRLIPDGSYTWRLTAEGLSRSERDEKTGSLQVEGGNVPLPLITDFTMSPQDFTPNQDGINDRVQINTAVSTSAEVRAYLIDENNTRLPISAVIDGRDDGEPGRYEFDYEGGVDLGADPPPDGTYVVRVEAQDAVGQRVVREAPLTLRLGGKPLAEIVSQGVGTDVLFTTMSYDERMFSSLESGLGEPVAPPDRSTDLNMNSITVPQGDLLVFMLTVENYGSTPIRTSGPPPGTVYQQDQLSSALGEFEQPGAWRVGLQCDTSENSYPWRWALGTAETLTRESDPRNDNTYLYLLPGQRVIVWGAVRLTEIVPTQNPQNCYAGLIHEGVEVSLRNNRVGVRAVLIAETDVSD